MSKAARLAKFFPAFLPVHHIYNKTFALLKQSPSGVSLLHVVLTQVHLEAFWYSPQSTQWVFWLSLGQTNQRIQQGTWDPSPVLIDHRNTQHTRVRPSGHESHTHARCMNMLKYCCFTQAPSVKVTFCCL